MSKLCGFLLAMLSAVHLSAGPTATLTGRATDIGGGVLEGVKVAATNVETNATFSCETNAEGLYDIPNLPPGTYRVIVGKFAFRTIVKPDIELHVQDVISLNFSMELGSVSESITVEGGAPLVQANASRGGDFVSRDARDLPLPSLNPVSLARTLPGVMEIPGAFLYHRGPEASFSINGQRFRANSYLLDSTDNNDITYTGIAQPFNMADAVEAVTVQAGNFGVEFGRAGGGIINVVTKSGTNSLHGALLWRFQSQRFDSVSNVDKLNQAHKPVFSHNVYGFTAGGPLRKDKTFFFGGFQQDTGRSTANFPLVVPTESAVSTLRSLFPANPRLDLYLKFLGSVRGTAAPSPLPLGDDPVTGANRGVVQFATATLSMPESSGGPQGLLRLDHNLSEAHRLGFRYVGDNRTTTPTTVSFPGFVEDTFAANQNFLFTDHYTVSPTWTNEFRFSYARQEAADVRVAAQSVPEALTLPYITASSAISTPGLPPGPELRKANNLLFQEQQTKLSGRHTLHYGAEVLKQFAEVIPSGLNPRGQVDYTSSFGYSAFANFLDDFSGPSGRWRKTFGKADLHPDQFHQSYFLQDTWLPFPALTLTLGLRYDNFGQVANSLRYPAFAGFDPANFLKPNHVNTDNKDFGPAFGLAWSPAFHSGLAGKLFGEGKTVLRGGYQISYDPIFDQAITLLLGTSSPNLASADVHAPGTGRGAPDWFLQVPAGGDVPSPQDAQAGALEKAFRNSYTERWSFGFQRQLPNRLVLDGSYVGSESHHLATWSDVNPRQIDNSRPHPDFGPRNIRTSEGNSSYHAMQWRVERRFAGGFQANASYTWSRNIDATSEGIGAIDNQGNQRNLPSMPVSQGGLKLDHGPSDYDRAHRFTVVYIWEVPGLSSGWWKHVIGGWSFSGIASFQSGAPFSLQNGFDRNNDTFTNDRPDIGNPMAPPNSRAVVTPASGSQFCSTGYRNPDTGNCVNRGDVHWIQGVGLPNAFTVGRNTLHAGGIENFDVDLTKSFRIGEQRRLEFRWEALNVLNHPQFTQIPFRDVSNTFAYQFLNRDFKDSGIRSMWAQVKIVF